mgnify:CR=1 FL=1
MIYLLYFLVPVLIYLAGASFVYFASYPGYHAVKRQEMLNKIENKEDNSIAKKIYKVSILMVILISIFKLTKKAVEVEFFEKIHLLFSIVSIIDCVVIVFVFCYLLGILAFSSNNKAYGSYQKLVIIIIIILITSLFKNTHYLILVVIFIDYVLRKNQNKLSRKTKKIIEITTTTVIIALAIFLFFTFSTMKDVNEEEKLRLTEGSLDLGEGVILNVIKSDELPKQFDFKVKYNDFETKTLKATIEGDRVLTSEISGEPRGRVYGPDLLENTNQIKHKNPFKDVINSITEDDIRINLINNFNFNYFGNQYNLKYNIYNPSRMSHFETAYYINIKEHQDLINLYFKFNSKKDNKTALEEDFLKIFPAKEQKEEIKRFFKTKMDVIKTFKKKDYVVAIVASNDVYEDEVRMSPTFVYNVSIGEDGEINVEKSKYK